MGAWLFLVAFDLATAACDAGPRVEIGGGGSHGGTVAMRRLLDAVARAGRGMKDIVAHCEGYGHLAGLTIRAQCS